MYLFDAEVLVNTGGIRKVSDVIRWKVVDGVLDLEIYDERIGLTYHDGFAAGFWRTITIKNIHEIET